MPERATCSRRALLLMLMAAALPVRAARTLPPELGEALPDARLLGEGKLRYLGLHVYDIRLWGAAAFVAPQASATPLALELQYARDLAGAAIAERSLKEMKGIGAVSAAQAQQWLAQLQQIFPDVRKGDRITGVQRPGEAALFFHNGQPRGEVRDAQFTRLFFGIWLSPQTSQPKLREALLGAQGTAG